MTYITDWLVYPDRFVMRRESTEESRATAAGEVPLQRHRREVIQTPSDVTKSITFSNVRN